MKDYERLRWKHIREQGRRHYVIRHGIVGVALPVGLLMWMIFYLFRPVFWEGTPPNFEYLRTWEFAKSIIVSAILWPIGGWLFGVVTWRRNEQKFARSAD